MVDSNSMDKAAARSTNKAVRDGFYDQDKSTSLLTSSSWRTQQANSNSDVEEHKLLSQKGSDVDARKAVGFQEKKINQEENLFSDDSNDDDCMLIATGQENLDTSRVSRLKQRILARELDQIRRESLARKREQSSSGKQIKILKLDLERKTEELAVVQLKMNALIKDKILLMEEMEMLKCSGKHKEAELQFQIRELKDTVSQLKQSQTDEDQYKQEIFQLREEVQQLRRENQVLMVELDAANEMETMKQQQAYYDNESRYQQEQEEQMWPIAESPSDMKQEEQQDEKLQQMEEELRTEREANLELREQLTEVRSQLKNKIDTLEMELQLQKMKFAQAQAKLMDMDNGNNKDNKERASASFGAQQQQQQQQIQQLQEKHVEELQVADMKAAEAEMRAEQLAQALVNTEEELSTLKKKQPELRKNLLSMNNQVVALTTEVKELKSRVKAKTGQLEIAQQQVVNKANRINELQKALEVYKNQAISVLGFFGAKLVSMVNEREKDECDFKKAAYSTNATPARTPTPIPCSSCQLQTMSSSLYSMESRCVVKEVKTTNSFDDTAQQGSRFYSDARHTCDKCGQMLSRQDGWYDAQGHQVPCISGFASKLVQSPSCCSLDSVHSPRRSPEAAEKEHQEANKQHPSPPSLLSLRSRALLSLLCSKQPWMAWIRRLLMLSAAVFVRNNAQWFLGRFSL